MSLIRCPECNAKVSDKALACPRCGFVAEDHLLPISQQVCSEVVPTFSCTVEIRIDMVIALTFMLITLIGCLVGFFFVKSLSFLDRVILVVVMLGILFVMLVYIVIAGW